MKVATRPHERKHYGQQYLVLSEGAQSASRFYYDRENHRRFRRSWGGKTWNHTVSTEEIQIARLAGLVAISSGDFNGVVESEHLNQAIDLMTAEHGHYEAFIEDTRITKREFQMEKALEYFRCQVDRGGWATRKMLRAEVPFRRWGVKRQEEILSRLVRQGKLKCERVGGANRYELSEGARREDV